ncbi:hypothetical protein ABBQ38_014833 [Trebouxia sp. C0009 RCD-2024]
MAIGQRTEVDNLATLWMSSFLKGKPVMPVQQQLAPCFQSMQLSCYCRTWDLQYDDLLCKGLTCGFSWYSPPACFARRKRKRKQAVPKRNPSSWTAVAAPMLVVKEQAAAAASSAAEAPAQK